MLLATAFVLRYQFFTFQSGYIQINIKSSMPAIAYLFTFQSGYIQIRFHSDIVHITIIFTFQSGYIQIISTITKYLITIFFTFQSGYIQINVRVCVVCVLIVLYIPIWLYSNGQLKKVLYHLALHSNLVIFKLNCST